MVDDVCGVFLFREEALPASPSKSEPEKPAAPRVKVNPFGAARPREEILKEKGLLPNPPTADELRNQGPTQGVAVELDPVSDTADQASKASAADEPVKKESARYETQLLARHAYFYYCLSALVKGRRRRHTDVTLHCKNWNL